MALYDLTHLMHSDMPVYPGKQQPLIAPAATIETDGYREMRLELDGHTGTHIDAPAHMLPNGKMLTDYPVSKFTGKAFILLVEEGKEYIEITDLKTYEKEIVSSDFVLFHTGWGRFWGTNDYLKGFPVLSEDAAKWLTTFHLKGIGIDAISVDPVESSDYPVHYIFFRADMVIIENLVIPEILHEMSGRLYCFPIHFMQADGAPVRAVFEIFKD